MLIVALHGLNAQVMYSVANLRGEMSVCNIVIEGIQLLYIYCENISAISIQRYYRIYTKIYGIIQSSPASPSHAC